MKRSEIISKFRSMTGDFIGLRTKTGYLFTDGTYSLEIFRLSNVATIFKGDSVLFG